MIRLGLTTFISKYSGFKPAADKVGCNWLLIWNDITITSVVSWLKKQAYVKEVFMFHVVTKIPIIINNHGPMFHWGEQRHLVLMYEHLKIIKNYDNIKVKTFMKTIYLKIR